MQRLAYLAVMLSFASAAEASVLIAPPVIGKGLDAARDTIDSTLRRELTEANIEAVESGPQGESQLEMCKNKLSCLARVGQRLKARHVLHTAVGKKGEEGLVQLTLISVTTGEAIKKVQMKSALGLRNLRDAIASAAKKLAFEIGALENKPPVREATPPIAEKAPPPVKEAPPPPKVIEERPAPEPPVSAHTDHPRQEKGPNYLMYGTGAGGIASVLAGSLFWYLASQDVDERDRTPQLEVDRRAELYDSALFKETMGSVFLITGGVALATSVVMWTLGVGESDGGESIASWSIEGANRFVVRW